MKTKVLVFSDVHCHQWQDNERPERWKDCIAAIHKVRLLCAQLKPDLVVFTGDLFESKRLLRSDIVVAAYNEMAKAWTCRDNDNSIRIVPAVYIAGNHDYYMQSCTLDVLASKHIKVVSKHSMVHCCYQPYDNTFLFVPHGVSALPNNIGVDALTNVTAVFTHADIAGAYAARSLLTKRDSLLPELLNDTPISKVVINGHYHHPQVTHLVNGVTAYMVGSLIQHSWSDADSLEPRGACLFEFENGVLNMQRYPIGDIYPKFYRASDSSKARTGIDFVIEKNTTVSNAPTQTHSNNAIAQVSSGTSEQIALGYLKHVKPELSGTALASYYKVGIECLSLTK